jgi:gentisate 1,2-dioxygenase
MLQRSDIRSSEETIREFTDMLAAKAVRPGWLPPLHTGKVETVEPFCWHWRDLRPDVLKALELVGTQQAERRILNCTNPGLDRGVTKTMVANFQIVGPGEIARAHRHTPAALRMIVESTGGYTVVNGDVVPMLEGDLVLTPNWTWHDHANDSQTPIIWLDGLDAPLVAFLNARFQEEYPEETQKAREDVDSSLLKYGGGSLRPTWETPEPDYSPQMHYPWTQTKATLDKLGETESGSSADGVMVEYSNPLTGGPVMPTIACFAQRLAPRAETTAHRHTSSTIYHVIEGEGATIIDGERYEWGSKDVICVPGWATHRHINYSSSHPAYLFSYSDAPVLKALRLYREEDVVGGD